MSFCGIPVTGGRPGARDGCQVDRDHRAYHRSALHAPGVRLQQRRNDPSCAGASSRGCMSRTLLPVRPRLQAGSRTRGLARSATCRHEPGGPRCPGVSVIAPPAPGRPSAGSSCRCQAVRVRPGQREATPRGRLKACAKRCGENSGYGTSAPPPQCRRPPVPRTSATPPRSRALSAAPHGASFSSRRPATASSRSAAQRPRPSPRASGSPPRSGPAPPSCAAAARPAPRSPQAGKPHHPSSRPNGRPLCRLAPNHWIVSHRMV